MELTLEIRDLDMGKIARLQSAIVSEARRIAAVNETSVSFEKYYENRGLSPTNASAE